ncbi:MAG: hypothetical protein U0821_21875 [Chloroflexota bacterium]
MASTIRTHVVIPKSVAESIDSLVGRRARSRFLTEAAEEKLRRLRLARVARAAAGSLANADTPGWESSESAGEWVRDSRTAADRTPEHD